MPNIEVYGFNEKERKEVSSKIAKIIANSSLPHNTYSDLVIIYIPSNCRGVSDVFHNFENETRPFLRVCSTEMEEIVSIAKVLSSSGYEVETLLLSGFYKKLKL